MHLLLFSIFLFLQGVPNDTTNVNSEIQSATVFLSGGEVHRRASVNLKPGTNHLVFSGLSRSLHEETMQLHTDGDIILESIAKSIDVDYDGSHADELKGLEAQKKQIENSISQREADLRVLDQKLHVLTANQDLNGENGTITPTQLKQAVDYFEAQFKLIEEKRIEINSKLNELNKQLAGLNRELHGLQRKQQQRSGIIEMSVQSKVAKRTTFDISYVVPGARWYPSYDVRVEDVNKPMDLIYQANISQNSGVNWNDIDLTISSAQPRRNTNLPVINPVYIRFYQPPPSRPLSSSMEKALPQEDLNEIVVTGYGQPIGTQLREGQTSFSFNIKTPYTVKSGEDEKTVAVKSYSLPADYEYISIPKKGPSAFLTAKIDDWESLNLLSGEADLFLNQQYVGKSELNLNSVQDTLSFSLGKDKGIVVERSQIESFREKNFFGNKVTETKGWDIKVRNTKSTSVTITITDQVPISTNEDINVDLKEKSGADYNKSTGKLTWQITLNPSALQTLTFVYETTYPSGKRIVHQEQ